jgi:hypothetical protein
LSKEFNDFFVLRLHYGNLLGAYSNTGYMISKILDQYNSDIFKCTAGLDEKFQIFIRNYFSNGAPEFFIKPQTTEQ